MEIIAKKTGTQRELIPAGNYIARCYQMIELGTLTESIYGKEKLLHKVRIGWELPDELKVFKEENGPQPLIISKDYTLSLHEKSGLRKDLKSWRSKDFTEKEAEAFDITKLLGIPCMLNIIHVHGKADPTKIYEQIAGITALPKGVKCPPQINETQALGFSAFDWDVYNSLPDFIKMKIRSSQEFASLEQPQHTDINDKHELLQGNGTDIQDETEDDLPF